MPRLALITTLWAVLCLPAAQAQTVIRVSPTGSAAGGTAGSLSLPDALTKLKDPSLRNATGEPLAAITLQLEPGMYRISQTLKLDAASSGSAAHPVTIQGPKDGSAIITGGQAVNGFTPVTDPATLARLPEIARAHVLQTSLPQQGISNYGTQARHGYGAHNVPTALTLAYRNRPLSLARWPNDGFAQIATTPDGEKGSSFTLPHPNLQAWQAEPHLLATGYWFHNWADATIPVRAINPATQLITLAGTTPPYGIKAGNRVFIQNALVELDQNGEWYLDTATGTLYVWPPAPPQAGDIEAAVLEKLFVISNASHITLNNLTFQSTRGDAITVQSGHHIAVAYSTLRNIGNRAVVVSGQDNGVTDSRIENIGEGAIVLQGGDRQTLTPANLYAQRNTIRRFAQVARTYQPAVYMGGVGNRAEGNTISDSAHTAILFNGNDHLIAQNDISNVCLETGDAGVIYTGRDWTARGTVIANNHLHSIAPNITWGRTKGVYLDDQASGITVRGNVFAQVDEAVFIGGGRDNLIEDNIFRHGAFPIHLDARGRHWQTAMRGILQQGLEAVPYSQGPYKDRYPNLANILDDELGMPKYNIARHNLVIGNSSFRIYKDAEAGISIDYANLR